MSNKNSILQEESTRTSGRDAIINNIDSIYALSEIVKTTLGPLGMDKMLIDSVGDTIITNDGVQILKSMDIDHPAAKLIIEVAKTQDSVVGDGTTSCVILIANILQEAKKLYLLGIHPNIILKHFLQGLNHAIKSLPSYATDISNNMQYYLEQIIITAMRGKSSEEYSQYLATLLVQHILKITNNSINSTHLDTFSKKKFKTLKIVGPPITSSKIINGIVFDKKRLLQSMPKYLSNPNILICSCPIEVQEIENSHQIQISNYQEYEQFIIQEKKYLNSIAQKIIELKVNVVICQKGVDDSIVSMLAKHNILVLRRCKKSDIEHLSTHSKAQILHNLDLLSYEYIQKINSVEVIEFEKEEVISFEIKETSFLSMIVCASTYHIVDEIDRAIEDSIGDVSNALVNKKIVGGGGSSFMNIYTELQTLSTQREGKEQLILEHLANSFLSIPKILSQNSGFDEIETLSSLKHQHLQNNHLSGIDCTKGVVEDVLKSNIIEPIGVLEQILLSSKEAISLILRIDDIIAAKKIDTNSIQMD